MEYVLMAVWVLIILFWIFWIIPLIIFSIYNVKATNAYLDRNRIRGDYLMDRGRTFLRSPLAIAKFFHINYLVRKLEDE